MNHCHIHAQLLVEPYVVEYAELADHTGIGVNFGLQAFALVMQVAQFEGSIDHKMYHAYITRISLEAVQSQVHVRTEQYREVTMRLAFLAVVQTQVVVGHTQGESCDEGAWRHLDAFLFVFLLQCGEVAHLADLCFCIGVIALFRLAEVVIQFAQRLVVVAQTKLFVMAFVLVFVFFAQALQIGLDQRDTALRIVGELLLQGWLHLVVELRHIDMLVDDAVRKLMAALFVGFCLFAGVTCVGMLVGKSCNLRLFHLDDGFKEQADGLGLRHLLADLQAEPVLPNLFVADGRGIGLLKGRQQVVERADEGLLCLLFKLLGFVFLLLLTRNLGTCACTLCDTKLGNSQQNGDLIVALLDQGSYNVVEPFGHLLLPVRITDNGDAVVELQHENLLLIDFLALHQRHVIDALLHVFRTILERIAHGHYGNAKRLAIGLADIFCSCSSLVTIQQEVHGLDISHGIACLTMLKQVIAEVTGTCPIGSFAQHLLQAHAYGRESEVDDLARRRQFPFNEKLET